MIIIGIRTNREIKKGIKNQNLFFFLNIKI
jgi:hypothetical protein